MAELQRGNLADALVALDLAVRLNPKQLDFNHTLLGLAYYRAGQHTGAVELWEHIR